MLITIPSEKTKKKWHMYYILVSKCIWNVNFLIVFCFSTSKASSTNLLKFQNHIESGLNKSYTLLSFRRVRQKDWKEERINKMEYKSEWREEGKRWKRII
jgi:hypothetical protein